MSIVIILMGVSGAGKTTIGRLLAQSLGWEFLDADDLHPAHNNRKMSAGIPLTDADREPWLRAVRHAVEGFVGAAAGAVIACSALKQAYREEIVADPSRVKIVYLRGTIATIAQRLKERVRHFMKPELLQSQFDILEEPHDAIVVDVCGSPGEIVESIRKRLAL